jgi:hypothetical protein
MATRTGQSEGRSKNDSKPLWPSLDVEVIAIRPALRKFFPPRLASGESERAAER